MTEHKSFSMAEEEKAFHRAADRELDLMEEMQAWVQTILNNSDPKIAGLVSGKYGVLYDTVLRYLTLGAGEESTFESIWKAYKADQGIEGAL